MKVLYSFKKCLSFSFTMREIEKANEALNLHYVNDKNCNVWDKGKQRFVAKYPELETEEFKEASHAVRRGRQFELEFELMEDGSVRLKQD